MTDDPKDKSDAKSSEGYKTFEAAMRRILRVRKEDIVPMYPEMFRERVADTKKKPTKKRTRAKETVNRTPGVER